MDILVSAIIPVYNSEKFLDRCIESLINQTLKEIEMIFIDDGSTDSSLEILRKYEKLDSRIKVITQENSGPSVARNRGIEIARGEYLSFIDSDDWIDVNMYEQMYNSDNKKSDLIICNIVLVENGIEHCQQMMDKEIVEYNKTLIKDIMISWLLSKSSFNSAANKLFKRSLILEHNIKLDIESDYGEDWKFNIDFLQYAQNAYYINKGFYYYRRGHESSSKKFDENTFNRVGLWLYNERKKYGPRFGFTGYEGSEELLNVFKYCIIGSCREGFNNINYIKTLVNNNELQESINYIDKSNLNKVNRLIIIFIKYKLNLFLSIYSNLCFLKSKK